MGERGGGRGGGGGGKSAAAEEDIEGMYTKSRGKLLNDIRAKIDSVDFVYNQELRDFIKLQDHVRKKVGCSKKPSPSAKKENASLIDQRNAVAKKALRSMESVLQQVKGDKGSKAVAALQGLAKSITEELKLKGQQANENFRVQFYPASVLRYNDVEKSPEDAFDVFVALENCAIALEHRSKKELLASKAHGLKTLMGELAHIIMERLRAPNSLEIIVSQAIDAFKQLAKADAAWADGGLQKMFAECKKQIKSGVSAFAELKEEQDIAELEVRLSAKKNNGTARQEEISKKAEITKKVEKAAVKLYAEQKAFFSLESKKWVLQRNYIPEIYHDLYPTFTSALDLLLQSVDVSNSDYRTVNDTVTDRTLAEYEDVRYLLPNVLSAVYRGKKCLLKRYSMARRQEVKAMCKELTMQKKLEAFVVERVSAVFADNSDMYLHFEQGDSDIYQFLQTPDFNDSVHNPILLIRHMLHVVAECHRAGVILGDIRPSSFVIDANGLPHIHAFKHARILSQTQGVRESIIDSERGEFEPPELKGCRDTANWKEHADVYALGKTIGVIAAAGRESLESVGAQRDIQSIIFGMTNENEKTRWNAKYALNKSDELLCKLKSEFENLRTQKEDIKDVYKALEKARHDLEYAAKLAEDDLLDVAHRKKEIEYQEEIIKGKMDKMANCAHAMEIRGRLEECLRVPDYWKSKSDKLWDLFPIEKKSFLFQVFRYVIQTDDPKSLNKGRDVKEKGDYTSLDLVGVWRLENPLLWRNYSVERRNMREMFQRRGIKPPHFQLRENLYKTIAKTPGFDSLYKDCNETYLIHGTGPDVLLSICTSGVNERFTNAALFGKGSYFAEDSAKNDQYVQGDSVLGGHPELHKRLFPTGGEYTFPEYPYKSYYIILCRVLVGFAVRVHCVNAKRKEMYNIDNKGSAIFATPDERELATIPGINNPPLNYHCLVAEKGGAIVRFREFCQFHSSRVYPEYLICYTRK
eukprot:GEMP01005901.1.p1 GENE.GEMP01005901.1~~GEMP01005901.1.p1  ORF type:complete len:979 (+),score=286.66 GEMP01005901.1:297-3233(+)